MEYPWKQFLLKTIGTPYAGSENPRELKTGATFKVSELLITYGFRDALKGTEELVEHLQMPNYLEKIPIQVQALELAQWHRASTSTSTLALGSTSS